MSIIHDALKKAQEQRKDKPGGVPFGTVPEVKKKPPYIVIGIVALVVVTFIILVNVVVPKFAPLFRSAKIALPLPTTCPGGIS